LAAPARRSFRILRPSSWKPRLILLCGEGRFVHRGFGMSRFPRGHQNPLILQKRGPLRRRGKVRSRGGPRETPPPASGRDFRRTSSAAICRGLSGSSSTSPRGREPHAAAGRQLWTDRSRWGARTSTDRGTERVGEKRRHRAKRCGCAAASEPPAARRAPPGRGICAPGDAAMTNRRRPVTASCRACHRASCEGGAPNSRSSSELETETD
jgi:hypothetical protein